MSNPISKAFNSAFGSKAVNQTSTSTPWGETVPAWQQGIGAAKTWAGSAPSTNQTGAWGTTQSAYNPNTWMSQGNPHLQTALNSATEDVTKSWQRANAPWMNQQSVGAGRMLGSTRQGMLDTSQTNLRKSLSDVENQFRMSDYNQRLGLMPQIGQMYNQSVTAQEQDPMARQQMLADFLSRSGGGTQTTPYNQPGWGTQLAGAVGAGVGAYKMFA